MTRHLIHVGFRKTGSTYLQSWFARHPDIAYEPWQLAGCESVHRLIEQATDGRADRPRVTSCEDFSAPTRMLKEWSGMAEAQLAVCRTLRALFPQASILIVTRSFEAIIASAYAELVRFGRAERFDEFIGSPTVLEVLPEILNYDRFILAYREAFDGRVTVLPYEQLRDDPARFLAAVEAVLGVDAIPLSDTLENARLSPEELRWYPRAARALARVPAGAVVRRKLNTALIFGIRSGRLRPAACWLDRWRPALDPPAAVIPPDVLERVRAGAARLLEEPSHRAYAVEYLGS